jgi:alpha-L-fucosidase
VAVQQLTVSGYRLPIEVNPGLTKVETMTARPTDDPFRDREVPQWFRDSKLGIFVHWGVYSVPAWAPPPGPEGDGGTRLLHLFKIEAESMQDADRQRNQCLARLLEILGPENVAIDKVLEKLVGENAYAEWYWNTSSISSSQTARHHRETWGDRDYTDFAGDFAEASSRWNPGDWASLMADAGARYAVLTTKHHDGYCLWPSEVPHPKGWDHWRSPRDLVGEYAGAVRDAGLRCGLYYSSGLDWSLKGLPTLPPFDAAILQSPEQIAYVDGQWRELFQRYAPDLIWPDIGHPRADDVHALLADYYARVPHGLVNDRLQITDVAEPTRHWDYRTTEYFCPKRISEDVWEECRGVGASFSYNQLEDDETSMLSVTELVHLLADRVSKNGNLLLGIGPRADGSVPEVQADRLRGLGKWLRVNGEAIYETRPWRTHAARTDAGLEVRFTRRDRHVYVIVLGTPRDSFVLEHVEFGEPVSVTRLGGGPAQISRVPEGTRIVCGSLPDAPAHGFRIASQ